MADEQVTHGSTTQPSYEELKTRLEAMEKATCTKTPYFQVSEKGAISTYNLGQRFPVTVYKAQMLALLTLATGYSEEEILASDWPIAAFIHEHEDRLSTLGRDTAKVQNTVVSARETAIKTTYDAIKKANPRMSVAEAEDAAYKLLGWERPAK